MAFPLFLTWTFILFGRPQDFLPFLVPLRLALVFALLTAGATLLERKSPPFGELFGLREGKAYFLFFLIMIAGIPFAFFKREAFSFVFLLYLANMLFFYYTLVHVNSIRRLKAFLFTVVLCTLFYGMFSLALGLFTKGRYSYGTMYDPNDLAFFLVSLFPISFYFILKERGFLKKAVAFVSAAVSVLTVLWTGSRGGFLGFAAVLALVVFSSRTGIKSAAKIVLLTVVALGGLLALGRINTERYTSLKAIGSDYNIQSETGRIAIWKKGLQIVISHPLTGVGASCFPTALSNIGEAQGSRPRWQAAHNTYLQVAAETGLPGLFLFVLLIVGALRNFSGSRRQTADPENREQAEIQGFLYIAFVGCLIPAFFLSQAYSILFTLFFGCSAVIRRLAAQKAAKPGEARVPPAREAVRPPVPDMATAP